MMETQSQRIRRLGNEGGIWHGQSGFYQIVAFPCNEYVAVPHNYARNHVCAGCGELLKPEPDPGTLQFAVGTVVKHLARDHYKVYHPDCADQSVPHAYAVGRREPKNKTTQLSLLE